LKYRLVEFRTRFTAHRELLVSPPKLQWAPLRVSLWAPHRVSLWAVQSLLVS